MRQGETMVNSIVRRTPTVAKGLFLLIVRLRNIGSHRHFAFTLQISSAQTIVSVMLSTT